MDVVAEFWSKHTTMFFSASLLKVAAIKHIETQRSKHHPVR